MAYYTVLSFGVEVALDDRRVVEYGRREGQERTGRKHTSKGTEENDALSSFFLTNDKPTHSSCLLHSVLLYFSLRRIF